MTKKEYKNIMRRIKVSPCKVIDSCWGCEHLPILDIQTILKSYVEKEKKNEKE